MAYNKMGEWTPDPVQNNYSAGAFGMPSTAPTSGTQYAPSWDRMGTATGLPVAPGATQSSQTVQYGQRIDPKYATGGEQYWREVGDGGGQWDYKPITYNTEGLDFGQAPVAGYVPVVGSSGEWRWMKDGNALMNQGEYEGMQYRLRTNPGEMGDLNQYNAIKQAAPGWYTSPASFTGSNHISTTGKIVRAASLGALAGMGGYAAAVAAPAALGGASGAGGAGTGMAAGEGAMLGGGTAPLTYGGTGGMVGGVGTAASALPAAGMAAGEGGMLGGGTAPLTSGSIPTAGSSNFLTQLQQMFPNMSAGDLTKLAGTFAGGGGGQGGKGGGSPGLIDLIGAYYSSQQNKDLAGNLKSMYSDALGRQQPYLQQLLASYQDPNSFYNSNQWKGLESVYQNQIDRQAAKGGTIGNPTDRERLLQAHAMKGLEDYRTGLRGNINALDPSKYAAPYAEGLKAEAFANTPWGATLAKSGIHSTQDLIGAISSGGQTAADIWKLVEGWFA